MLHVTNARTKSANVVSIQRCYRRYQERVAEFILIKAVTIIQSQFRGRLARSYVSKRMAQEEETLLHRVHDMLDDLVADGSTDHGAILHGLLRVVQTNPEKLLYHVRENLKLKHFWVLVRDLGSICPNTRVLSCRFLARICHNSLCAQRLLCQVSGFFLPGVRVFSVPSRLRDVYESWCVQHGANVTEKGFVTFVKAIVNSQIQQTQERKAPGRCSKEVDLYGFESPYPPSVFCIDIQGTKNSQTIGDPMECIVGISLSSPVHIPVVYAWELNQMNILARVFRLAVLFQEDTLTKENSRARRQLDLKSVNINAETIKQEEQVSVKFFVMAMQATQVLKSDVPAVRKLKLRDDLVKAVERCGKDISLVLHKSLQVGLQCSHWLLHAAGVNGSQLLEPLYADLQLQHDCGVLQPGWNSEGEFRSKVEDVADSDGVNETEHCIDEEPHQDGVNEMYHCIDEKPHQDGTDDDGQTHQTKRQYETSSVEQIVLGQLLKSNVTMQWSHLSKLCASAIWEQSVQDRIGKDVLDLFWNKFSTNTELDTYPGDAVSKIPRGELVANRCSFLQALRELGTSASRLLSGPKWMEIRERVAGGLLIEDRKSATEIGGIAKYVISSDMVRDMVNAPNKTRVDSMFGDGSCPWDWVTWIEFLCILREVGCPSREPLNMNYGVGFLIHPKLAMQRITESQVSCNQVKSCSRNTNQSLDAIQISRELNNAIHEVEQVKKKLYKYLNGTQRLWGNDPVEVSAVCLVLWTEKSQLQEKVSGLSTILATTAPSRAPIIQNRNWITKSLGNCRIASSAEAFERYLQNRKMVEVKQRQKIERIRKKEQVCEKRTNQQRQQQQRRIQATKRKQLHRFRKVKRNIMKQQQKLFTVQDQVEKQHLKETNRLRRQKLRKEKAKSKMLKHKFMEKYSQQPARKQIKKTAVPQPTPPPKSKTLGSCQARAKQYDRIIQARNKLIVTLNESTQVEGILKRPSSAPQRRQNSERRTSTSWVEDAAQYWMLQHVTGQATQQTHNHREQNLIASSSSEALGIPALPTVKELRAKVEIADGTGGICFREVVESDLLRPYTSANPTKRLSHRVAVTIAKQLQRRQVALKLLAEFRHNNPYSNIDDAEFINQIQESLQGQEEDTVYRRYTGRTKDEYLKSLKPPSTATCKTSVSPQIRRRVSMRASSVVSNCSGIGSSRIIRGGSVVMSTAGNQDPSCGTLIQENIEDRIRMSIQHDKNLKSERASIEAAARLNRRNRLIADLEVRTGTKPDSE